VTDLKQAVRVFAVVVSLVLCCSAQHLRASASFPGTNTDFTLTNFDTANSGSGNVYRYNGQSVNWYVEWTRDANGNVTITYLGDLMATLEDAQQNSTGGDATLNDGKNTGGTWTRG